VFEEGYGLHGPMEISLVQVGAEKGESPGD